MSLAPPMSACRENDYLVDAFSLSSGSSSSVLDGAVGYGSSSTPLSAASSVGGNFGSLSNRRMRMVYDTNLPRDQLIAMKRARKRQLNRESAQRVREKRKMESSAFETQLRATRMALDVARKQLAEILAERNELRRRLARYENSGPAGREFNASSSSAANNDVPMSFGTTTTNSTTANGQFKPFDLNNIFGGSIFSSTSVTPSSVPDNNVAKPFPLTADGCGLDNEPRICEGAGGLEDLKASGVRGDSFASSSALTGVSYSGSALDGSLSAAWNTFTVA